MKTRTRNAKRRDRAQPTNRAGTPRHGQPVGRFGRPHRRMAEAIAVGERLERDVGRAETPQETERAQRALIKQIAKVERLNHVLTR